MDQDSDLGWGGGRFRRFQDLSKLSSSVYLFLQPCSISTGLSVCCLHTHLDHVWVSSSPLTPASSRRLMRGKGFLFANAFVSLAARIYSQKWGYLTISKKPELATCFSNRKNFGSGTVKQQTFPWFAAFLLAKLSKRNWQELFCCFACELLFFARLSPSIFRHGS